MKSKITKELLFKHFMGKTSAMQKQMIDEWTLEKANEEQFYAWLEEYENVHPEYEANVDKAVADYHFFLKGLTSNPEVELTQAEPILLSRKRNQWIKWAVAASVTVILSMVAFLTKDSWQYQTYRTHYGETKTFQLTDGSEVTLNANSSLRVPRWGFGERTRNVYMEGEATFSVKHTPTHQKFIVQTAKKFEVEVLGTEFIVFARARGSKVVLNKGKVQLNFRVGNTTQKMMMKPGDLILLDNENNVRRKSTPQPEIHAAWRGHRYIFEQTTLQEIIYLLAENYGIKAEVDDKELLTQTLSGTFTAENADELLELIQGVLDLHITRQDNKAVITQLNQ
jgi:ferric-dicitrate binding protein FerR (iron transport regulator)